MIIALNNQDINITEREWAENFPGLCYRDRDNDPNFYLSWNTTRGFLFPDADLPENGPVIWSSSVEDWVQE